MIGARFISPSLIRIANAPCSWGVIENVAGKREGYAWVLDEMHETGYQGTELGDWGFMPTDPATLRRELEARDLSLLASWVTVYLHDPSRLAESEAAAVRTARLLAEVGGPDAMIVLGNDPYTDPTRTKNAGRIKSVFREPTLHSESLDLTPTLHSQLPTVRSQDQKRLARAQTVGKEDFALAATSARLRRMNQLEVAPGS